MTKLILLTLITLPTYLMGQPFTAAELLDKTIRYHDPNGNWDKFNSILKFGQDTPDKTSAYRWAHINNVAGSFAFWQEKEEGEIRYFTQGDSCRQTVASSTNFSEEIAKKYKLTCKRSQLWRDYYTYLYGLPMKLKDPGALLSDTVLDTSFMDTPCWAIAVTYDEAVGKDAWYFYLDKSTFALLGYRFFHDESQNDGEYIVLKGEIVVQGLRIPKVRSWYYNSDGKFLGVDDLVKYEVKE